MKTLKKLFSVSAIVALLGTLAPMYAFGATYSDELQDAYKYAYAHEVTTMTSIDNANMYGNLKRIEMAKMLANYAINVLGATPDTTKSCTFPDVPAALDAQYDNGVTKACQLGLMGVGIENFNPNGTVTRAEFGTAFSRALNHDSEDLAEMNAATPYYKKHLEFLKSEGIMTQIDNPNQVEVRGYVMLMMMRADDSYSPSTVEGCTAEELLKCITADDYDACIAACSDTEEPGDDEEELTGFVKVSKVSAENQTVAKNAVNKKVGTIKLTAGENDTKVTAITVKVPNVSTANSVYVKVNKYGTAKPVSTSTKTVSLRLSPAVTIKAKSSMTFDIIANLDKTTAGDEYQFSVTEVTVVNGEAEGLPVTLGTLKTNNYEVAELTAGTDITLNAVTSLVAGKTQEKLADITVTSPVVNAKLLGITLTDTNASDVDLTEAFDNVKLYNNNTAIATATVTKDRIEFSDLDLDSIDGEEISLTVKADTIYVGSAKDITLTIEKNEVLIKEIETNEEMATDAKLTAANDTTLKDAEFTITKMTSGDETVAPGTNNVVLFDAKITSSTEFDVTTWKLVSDTAFANTEFSKVTIYVNGVDYIWLDNAGVSTDATSATQYDFTKDDLFTVSPNQPARVKVIANVKSSITGTPSYKLTMTVSKLKNPDENTEFALSTPKTKVGDKVTLGNGSFTITQPNSLPTNKTVVAGEESDVLYFNLLASSEDQALKDVTVSIATAAKFKDVATKVALMQGDDEVKSFETDDLDVATLTFDGNYRQLKKDEATPFTIRMTVKGDAVAALGEKFAVNMDSVNVVRYKKQSEATSTTSTLIAGNEYQIASTLPSITIPAKEGANTTIAFSNASSYDLKLNSMKFTITKNKVEGGNYAQWMASEVKFLTAINGSDATAATDGSCSDGTSTDQTTCEAAVNTPASCSDGTSTDQTTCEAAVNTPASCSVATCGAGDDEVCTTKTLCEAEAGGIWTDATYHTWTNATYHTWTPGTVGISRTGIPGEITVTFPAGFTMTNSLSRVVELVSLTDTIETNDYTLTVKELNFNYVDRTTSATHVNPIVETYNIAK